jgi:hypothetical protein
VTAPPAGRLRAPAVPVLIALALALQLWLAICLNVNWDEFYFLNLIHEQRRGTLDQPLQTFHVHLLAWLPLLPADEIGQITAGRFLMAGCQWATLWLVWATARAMAGCQAALLGVLAYLAAEFTLAHGASFRADPLAAALLMLALHIVAVRRLNAPQMVVAALAGALAGLVTIKSALYLPALLGAAIWRLSTAVDRRDTLMRLAATAALGLVALGALFLWHRGQLGPPQLRSAVSDAGGAFRTTLLAGALPRASELAFWAPRSVVLLFLLVLGLVAARNRERLPALAIALFAAPLLSVLFYRNAFPYFFPFITAPAALVAAVGAGALARGPTLRTGLLVLSAASLLTQILRVLPHDQLAQRAVLAAVHAAFPEPVPYIDRAGMVSTFPRQGFFMSTWGLGAYRSAGVPLFPDILQQSGPPLIIANAYALDVALRGQRGDPDRPVLLEADAATLHDSYIQHWGPIWVAGKRLTLDGGARAAFDIAVSGPYTVEAQTPVRIDGRDRLPGAVVALARGRHFAQSTASAHITLRYGKALPRPAADPPAGPIFWGFLPS